MALDQNQEAHLSSWFSKLRSRKVELVGDYAGDDLFLIHGESLIRHCLKVFLVDFTEGFQLLHAIHAVETFLNGFYARGCNFDLVFFRSLCSVSAPAGTSRKDDGKYQLFRTILIQHLGRNPPEDRGNGVVPKVLDLTSPSCHEFVEYRKNNPVRFIMCHEGDYDSSATTTRLQGLVCYFVEKGYDVAFMGDVDFQSSKIFAQLVREYSTSAASPNSQIELLDRLSDDFLVVPTEDCRSFQYDPGMTLSEHLTALVCEQIVEDPALFGIREKDVEHAGLALLLQVCIIRASPIHERQHWTRQEALSATPGTVRVLGQVCRVFHKVVLSNWSGRHEVIWDLYDLVDGRVYLSVCNALRAEDHWPPAIIQAASELSNCMAIAAKDIFTDWVKRLHRFKGLPTKSTTTRALDSKVLPFSHPVMNNFLQGMKLSVSDERARDAETGVFQDLYHWHNKRLLRTPTSQLPVLSERAQRARQRLMADVTDYSASLVGANGKALKPETIVTERKTSKSKATQHHPGQKRGGGKGRSGAGKGGSQAAHEAARAVQAKKAIAKRGQGVSFWEQERRQLEELDSPVEQYLKALKFLEQRTTEERVALRGEVHLYLCKALSRLLPAGKDTAGGQSEQSIIALIFRWLQETALQECTKTVLEAVASFLKKLHLPALPLPEAKDPDNHLPFKVECRRTQALDHRQLQLQSGGPYMDRRFDPEPDDRVSFEPDAWQRKVLDSIDARNSTLIIAPTSAGKTFISFYAMKQVLRESDDGVLVYVSPTKALVNQTAAEILARFSKSYDKAPGTSVWAIHTRDYRVNNPTGCQVLVTVPHILQIMLLSSANTAGERSFSKRIKRIIFDEVHCIGQAEDSVVWEQLLLMAPCPVTALSATVGNPVEFKNWLAASQERKGYKLDMIVHGVRYSDLRKFIYQPRPNRDFKGLEKLHLIPVPGLDEAVSAGDEFTPVHPISALSYRDPGALKDLSLEARDCYSLWRAMQSALGKDAAYLSPEKHLPDVITKFDVVQWESTLKDALAKLMVTSVASFHLVQRKLLPKTRTTASHGITPIKDRDIDGIFPLVCDLHRRDALPAIIFNYDRSMCVSAVETILQELEDAEAKWKKTDSTWKKKLSKYQDWKRAQSRSSSSKLSAPAPQRDEERALASKLERERDEATTEGSPWESFDPDAPVEQFSFAGISRVSHEELEELTRRMKSWVPDRLLTALGRGLGVHHAGMNRRYRQLVERLFRRGYLRVVVATGTLALGIHMPCPTVVFCGDSIFLTAQNYRQASGRAGRRGFDLLGNVVFLGIPEKRVHEIMSSRLPDLKGQFPITTSLVLRLFGLLHGTENDKFAAEMVQSLLEQTRLYLGGEEASLAIKHHVRFSIDYLRRQHLLSSDGAPVNFAGMIGHLYYAEAAAFAFHALLKGGYFHKLCSRRSTHPSQVKQTLMLVLSHIFGVLPITHTLRSGRFQETVHKSSSVVFLPELPPSAKAMLMQHNRDTLSVLTNYVSSYVVSGNLERYPEQTLPFSRVKMAHSGTATNAWVTEERLLQDPAIIRSPFVALSGYDDNFNTIRELCLSVRDDAFLEESAVPCIPVWPDSTPAQPNAYLFDFFKHGSMKVLVRDNLIRAGDVWQLLDDFSKILATIVTSLEVNVEDRGSEGDDEGDYEDDLAEDLQGLRLQSQELSAAAGPDLDADDSDSDSDASATVDGKGDLSQVLRAFRELQAEFDAKFRKNFA